MKLNIELFGVHAFRKSLRDGVDRKTLINISLFDVLSVSFAILLEKIGVVDYRDFEKVNNIEQLKIIINDLLNDETFIDSISKGTNGRLAVSTRYDMVAVKFSEYLRKNYE